MTGTYARTTRTSPTRYAGRVAHDRAAVHAVLDEAVICHVGFVVDGHPVVLPQLHARVEDTLTRSRLCEAKGNSAKSSATAICLPPATCCNCS